MNTPYSWQLVIVLWGTKYGVAEVNHLIHAVRAHSSQPPRVVLITDRPRDGLAADVITRPFPAFFLQPDFLRGGCQAKLSLFEAGVVPDDLPAIFMDLDTVVLGDMARFLALQTTPQTIAIFQSAILPFGALGRAVWRATSGRRYARGNSSIVVYHPRECGFIAERFRALFGQHGHCGIKPMVADERFVSWAAQPMMRAIPRHMAVKFPTEFMLPWRWLIHLRARLPWNQRRWAGLLAVTLPGVDLKGQDLSNLAEGTEIVDRKGRRLIWTDRALGPVRGRIIAYYRALQGDSRQDGQP
ncbi:MAG: hypothetical protein V4712_15495 [Pseudomonadota bacterium]